ncbi:MAG: DUF2156 domain-containing protein [Oscillospiraceae bacterium]|nr:DUF2156 domain-containing protein [Oscillospiraceae bacterium]
MLSFKTVTLCDKAWVDEIVRKENSPSADYNFGNIYIWDKYYRQLICRFGDRMLTKLRYEGKPAFVFPIGSGELKPAIEALREFAAFRGYPLVIRGITGRHREQLEALYPGQFVFEPETKNFDYIYRAEKLATYSGKSMHGKKNHCNRFEAENDWRFVPLTRELIPGCLDMLVEWNEDNRARLDPSISFEHDALIRAFAAYERLDLEGGVLTANGRIVGFSLGEMASDDTFDVHFEKAALAVNGAYPMVCRELTRMLLAKYPKLAFINREDDMGFESLRQSKLSYKPEYLLEKYIARGKDEESGDS